MKRVKTDLFYDRNNIFILVCKPRNLNNIKAINFA